MKKRLHLFIILGFYIILFILGSFLDLKISNGLYINTFAGNIFSAFGLILGYGAIALYCGLLFGLALKHNNKILKICLIIISILVFIAGVYFSSHEMVSTNGLNLSGIGYFIMAIAIDLVFYLPISYFGYKLSLNLKGDKMWLLVLIMIIAMGIAIILGGLAIKEIFHRPRYRTVIKEIEGIEFHNWWKPFKEYKNYLNIVNKEEFKSFPSGHATTSMIAMAGLAYLPIFIPKLKDKQVLLTYIAFIYSLFISYTRIMAGAHYLTDVSAGSIITLLFFIAANEIIIRMNLIEDLNDINI